MRIAAAIIAVAVTFTPLSARATEVREVTSPGGLKAWLVEEHALPLVAVRVVFTGSGHAYDPAGKEGRAGMLAALLTEGAGGMDWKAFNAALEDRAIRLDFSVDEDYFNASMQTLSDYKDDAFSYLGQSLVNPRFDDSAIERVRSQSLSVLAQQEKKPSYLLERGWQAVAFANHPYGKPVLGTAQSIGQLKKADFTDAKNRYLTRENMVIAAVGDVTPEQLGALLDKHLGGLPAHYAPEAEIPSYTLPKEAKQQVIESDIPQTMVLFGSQGVMRDAPDYYAAYILNQLLGGSGLTSKLSIEIREKKGLAYSVYSQLDPMRSAAVWRGGFATRNDQVGQAADTLRDTLRSIAAKGPSDKELAEAKQYVTGSFILNLDSNADIANYLISMQLNHLGRDYLDKRNQLMSSVTRQQVADVAKKMADPDHLLMVMVGKPKLTK